MKLYHVSLNLENINEFIPRIPSEEVMVEGEDSVTPRICLGKNIRGCLTAVPWGGNTFEELFFDNITSQIIRVYEFDSEDIAEENLISSEELYRSDRVRDSEISGEVWVINQSLKPKKSYLIQINDYSEGSEDDISYEDLVNFNEDEDDYDDILNGCFTTVEAIQYDIIEECDFTEKITLEFNVKIKDKDVNKNEDKDTYDFLSSYFNINTNIENMSNIDFINDKIDSFLSEYWEDRNITTRKMGNEDIYKVQLYVDLHGKFTTKKNFLSLLKADIAITSAIEFLD